MPVTRFAARPRNRWQVACRHRSILSNLFECGIKIGCTFAHSTQRAVLMDVMTLAAMLEQWPGAGRHDRCFMCPLLRILTSTVGEFFEAHAIVRAEP